MLTSGTHDHAVAHMALGAYFDRMVEVMQARFDQNVRTFGPHLFETDALGLFDIFLGKLPAHERQHHTCNCCREFVRKFGALVHIDAHGQQIPAFWGFDGVPAIYAEAIEALHIAVRDAKVTGPFLHNRQVWGVPEQGGFGHFHIRVPGTMVHTSRKHSPEQVMAAKRQDYGSLNRALGLYGVEVVGSALNMLQAEALPQSHRYVSWAKMIHDLHFNRSKAKGRAAGNLVWLAVAGAPDGWCAPQNSVLGTLMDDIKAGHSFDTIARKMGGKVAPLKFQRAQVAPSAGNIAAAEKLVAKLGIEASLARRWAHLDEIQKIWTPRDLTTNGVGKGVFGHLKAKGAPEPLKAPMPKVQAISWVKFARTALPNAHKIELLTERVMRMIALTTAVNPDAPPIYQWDREDARNPFAWYVYPKGSPTTNWCLPVGQLVKVNAVTLLPPMWGGEDAHPAQGKSAIFVLDGAMDQQDSNLAIFQSCLKSDLHEIRSTIEAFSNSGRMLGKTEQSANGVRVGDASTPSPVIVVTSQLGQTAYRIDRWD